MKITVNWEKAWPAVFIAFLAGLPLLLIAGLIHWRLGWLKAYQQKLASAVGSLRNDSQLNTPKAILIDLIRALPVCLIILAVGLILLTMQLNISELLWSFSKKTGDFLAGAPGTCANRYLRLCLASGVVQHRALLLLVLFDIATVRLRLK